MKPEEIERVWKMSGLNQKEFAGLFGRSARTLQNYINGSNFPDAQIIDIIEEVRDKYQNEKDPKNISGLVFEKNGVSLNEDQIVMFFAQNEKSFLRHKIIRNIIDREVSKKLVMLTSDKDKFMEFLNG